MAYRGSLSKRDQNNPYLLDIVLLERMEPVSYNREQSKLFEHFSKSRGDNEKICMEWSDLHYSILTKDAAKSSFFVPVYKNKTILRSMHGKVTSGELLAIMGPTGKFLTRFLCTNTVQLSLKHTFLIVKAVVKRVC